MKTLLWFKISALYCYSIVILGSQRSKEGWEGMRVRKLPELGVRGRISPRKVPQYGTEEGRLKKKYYLEKERDSKTRT